MKEEEETVEEEETRAEGACQYSRSSRKKVGREK
jgi:hypothetical protein